MGGIILSDEDKERILLLQAEGVSQRKIADQIGRDKETVGIFLASVAPSRLEAKAILGAAMAPIMQHVVNTAKEDAGIGLEVLDRAKVLQKVREVPQAQGGMRLHVLIGGATSGPGNLVPTQETILAIQAEQKALAEGDESG